jgi:hypothetical protein
MKLSFGKKSLDTKLNQLRHRNQAFVALSEQIFRHNAYSWTPLQTRWDEQSTENSLEKIKALRDAAQTLHHGLEQLWTCEVHPNHSANIRLYLSTAELLADTGSKITFDITLTSWDLGDTSSGRQNPTMLAVEVLQQPDDLQPAQPNSRVHFDQMDSPSSNAPESKLKRRTSADITKTPRVSRLRRAFRVLQGKEDEVPNSTAKDELGTQVPTRSKERVGLEATIPDLGSVTDLCARILTTSQASFDWKKKCIGYFNGSNASKYVLYNQPLTAAPFVGAVSLSHMILNSGGVQALTKPEKWRLAGALSMATLLFHSTPWLRTGWETNDVLFFYFNSDNRSNLVKSPHLHSLSRMNQRSTSNFDGETSLHLKNELIHRLGLILLELEFNDSFGRLLENLQSQGLENLSSIIASPLVLLKQKAGEHLGTLYGRIVRICLDCDFGLGLNEYSLHDPAVQKVFYSRIVRQFQERMPEYSRVWDET